MYRGIPVVRKAPTVVTNPNSTNQSKVRTAVGYFGGIWKTILSTDKDSWEHFARTQISAVDSEKKVYRGAVIKPPQGPLHGFNAFIQCNMNRYMSGLSLIDDAQLIAPIGLPRPDPITSLTVLQSGYGFDVAWTTSDPNPKTDRIEIWLRNISGMIHTQMIATANVIPNGTVTISTVRGASGIAITPPPGLYMVQAQIINDKGLASTPSEIIYYYAPGDDVFTWLTPRVLMLNLPGILANIAWTTLGIGALVPVGAHSIIATMDTKRTGVGGTLRDSGYFQVRRDVTQDVCMRQKTLRNVGAGVPADSEQGIIPVTSSRTFQYNYVLTFAGSCDITMYLIGYIT
jgi:hypothetical protein